MEATGGGRGEEDRCEMEGEWGGQRENTAALTHWFTKRGRERRCGREIERGKGDLEGGEQRNQLKTEKRRYGCGNIEEKRSEKTKGQGPGITSQNEHKGKRIFRHRKKREVRPSQRKRRERSKCDKQQRCPHHSSLLEAVTINHSLPGCELGSDRRLVPSKGRRKNDPLASANPLNCQARRW